MYSVGFLDLAPLQYEPELCEGSDTSFDHRWPKQPWCVAQNDHDDEALS